MSPELRALLERVLTLRPIVYGQLLPMELLYEAIAVFDDVLAALHKEGE